MKVIQYKPIGIIHLPFKTPEEAPMQSKLSNWARGGSDWEHALCYKYRCCGWHPLVRHKKPLHPNIGTSVWDSVRLAGRRI